MRFILALLLRLFWRWLSRLWSGWKNALVVAKSTVERYMVKRPKPAAPTWRSILANHVVVLSERHLRRVLTSSLACYHAARCHMSLDGNAPEHRDVQPPRMGKVIELPEVGELHHRHVRHVA